MLLSLVTWMVISVFAAAAPSEYHIVHEKRHVPNDWIKKEKIEPDAVLPMRIGLVQSNLEKGYDLILDVSHPSSVNYGRYYTAEQVADIFAPSEASVNAVRSWLEDTGIDLDRVSISTNKQWLQLDAKASEANESLRTQYHLFEHATTGKTSVACDEYSVPRHVQQHVDYMTPGVKLLVSANIPTGNSIEKRTFGWGKGRNPVKPPEKPLPMPISRIVAQMENGNELASCDEVITPPCISAMYNITRGTKKALGNQLGIFEDLGDVYSQTDLNKFFAGLAPQIPQGTHPKLKAIDGAVAPTSVPNAGAESDLDFQISFPIIWPQNSVLFQTDDPVYEANYNYSGFFNNFLDAIDGSYCTYSAFDITGNSPIDPPYPHNVPGGYNVCLQCGAYKPTNVISISYGGIEAGLPVAYQKRQCNEFMKLGLQGVSVVLSSGDSGVAGPGGGCLNGKIFNPDFPATCPYIITVGATYLPSGADVKKDQEVAVTRFGSGGGFSNIYPQPAYQKQAVANYFSNHNPPYPYYSGLEYKNFGANGGLYNRIGRAYPDVAGIGDNVAIFNKGNAVLIGGTSASAPVFASILNRINEERLAKGKSTVGFVNPVLYDHPEVLHDIVTGNNPGCNTNGFSASSGWDPVTGLGTPSYKKMLKLFMSMP